MAGATRQARRGRALGWGVVLALPSLSLATGASLVPLGCIPRDGVGVGTGDASEPASEGGSGEAAATSAHFCSTRADAIVCADWDVDAAVAAQFTTTVERNGGHVSLTEQSCYSPPGCMLSAAVGNNSTAQLSFTSATAATVVSLELKVRLEQTLGPNDAVTMFSIGSNGRSLSMLVRPSYINLYEESPAPDGGVSTSSHMVDGFSWQAGTFYSLRVRVDLGQKHVDMSKDDEPIHSSGLAYDWGSAPFHVAVGGLLQGPFQLPSADIRFDDVLVTTE